MTKKKTISLSQKQSDELMPVIREFNKITSAVMGLIGKRVESKEKKISILVSQIRKPDEKNSRIKVETVKFTQSFLKNQRKKKNKLKNPGESEWDDHFTEKRGYII